MSCGHRAQDLEEELAGCGVPAGHEVNNTREGAMSPGTYGSPSSDRLSAALTVFRAVITWHGSRCLLLIY